MFGEVMIDGNNNPVPYDDRFYLKFGPQPTFADDDWVRYEESDPNKPMGWKEFDNRWDSRELHWTMPIDWVNYSDSELGKTSEYSLMFRYFIMLYYGVLNLGNGEFGPVNGKEFCFLIVSMILSSMLMSIVFGDVAALIATKD